MNVKLICSFPSHVVESNVEVHQEIFCHETVWRSLGFYGSRFVVVLDDTLADYYLEQLKSSFLQVGLESLFLTFPSGECFKTRETKSQLEDQMLKHGCGRDTCLIAVGGGVTLDLGGYIASTYCRGIPFVSIPTSLLAMVDASIGGKNGVNTPYGKNMVGGIYQPKKVVIDPWFLKTLPVNELRNGFVEMIKHGLIADSAHFEDLENFADKLLALDSQFLSKVILDSCKIKKSIVEEDEKEIGLRRALNFGHTVGHALEVLTDYSLSHGEAVAIGMLVEAYVAVELDFFDKRSFDRLRRLLCRYGLPLKLPQKYSLEQLMQAMVLDKKSLNRQPRFVLPNAIGNVCSFDMHYCTFVEQEILTQALQWMNDDLRCH